MIRFRCYWWTGCWLAKRQQTLKSNFSANLTNSTCSVDGKVRSLWLTIVVKLKPPWCQLLAEWMINGSNAMYFPNKWKNCNWAVGSTTTFRLIRWAEDQLANSSWLEFRTSPSRAESKACLSTHRSQFFAIPNARFLWWNHLESSEFCNGLNSFFTLALFCVTDQSGDYADKEEFRIPKF